MKKKIPFLLLGLALSGYTQIQAQWTTSGTTVRLNTTSNKVGIGVTSTSDKLHIYSSSSQNALRAQVNGSTKLLVASNGGVSVGSPSVATANGLYVNGSVGIGTTAPGSYKVKITHGTFGVDIESASTGNDWEFWSNSGGLSLFANGTYVGNFSLTDGVYSPISDARFKTDVKAMPSILEKVNQLKPSTYHFKKEVNPAPESYGLLAQDVMKIFPSLVTHNVNKERGLEAYTLNYSGLSVIAIKAIQELQQTMQEQKQKIDEQKQQIEDQNKKIQAINDALNKLMNNQNDKTASLNISLSNTTLDSWPNPAQNSTTIRYNMPTGFKNAQVLITDNSGVILKRVQLTAGNVGLININTAGLKSGTYTYSLIGDGEKILSKKLVIAK